MVRLLEDDGWWACWVKHWSGSREFCLAPGEATVMPDAARTAFFAIERAKGGGSGGAWDVYAWKDGPLFIESKQHRSSDRLNANQVAWLSAAVSTGIDSSCFAVVNYETGPPVTLSVERMQTITVDADIGRPTTGYTPEEKAFRREVAKEIREIHAKGGMVDFGPGEIDW